MDLTEIGARNLIDSSQDRDYCRVLDNTVFNLKMEKISH